MTDVLVVGAGSAGCIVAERFSRNRSVVLVEAGSAATSETQLDRLNLGTFAAPSRVARWYGDSPPIVRGRAVGGSAVVNGGYFRRAPSGDFADWSGPFTVEAIDVAYGELAGDGAGGGKMSVAALADEELPPMVLAMEGFWPTVRVPINRRDGKRWTAADAYLAPARDRSSLTVLADSPVARLLVERGRVVGAVLASGTELRAAETVVCAGTLGTAELLFASGVIAGELPVWEHREMLVRYDPRRREASRCPVLLPTVAEIADGVEVRCYASDFADFIPGLPGSTPAVGVAEMRPAQPGRLNWDGSRLGVDLAPIGDVRDSVESVVAALSSSAMADFVEAGSVCVESAVGTSQHAWGSLAMGERTDWLGAVDGVPGLRVVDGSILPNVSSGPHATVMMAAIVITDALR